MYNRFIFAMVLRNLGGKKEREKIYLLITGLFWDGCEKYENSAIFGAKLHHIAWVYSKILKLLLAILVIINARHLSE